MTSSDLTVSQFAAVEHFEGPLLVLAGPGSGKTRVITRRIARLIERGVSERQVLAITFTNKAAREMAERVDRLIPGSRVWVTTFHKFCARMLRQYGQAVGLQSNFTIFDTADQHQLLKQVLHGEDIDATHFPPSKIGWQISQAKNDLISADQFASRFEERIGNHVDAVVARVYPRYQQRLLEANAVDFDDLLVHTTTLLRDHDDLREQLDHRFRYILVDEYQDTNRAQYEIVAALSQHEPNLCATGDPDQSIYGWRGAKIENILRFERDFPDVSVIRLEDNFRSTPEILKAADELIVRNRRRKAKRLTTANASGAPVELRLFLDGVQEATAISSEIQELVTSGERKWSDFAIFYRVNSLSRTLETALARAKVPYQVASGVAFYERSEVKDLIGYLRLIENPRDRMAFLRIVNTPTRGIGKTSVDKLLKFADEHQLSPLEVAANSHRIPGLTKRAAAALRQFAQLMLDLQPFAVGPVAALLGQVLARTNYGQHDGEQTSNENELQRRANVDELISAAAVYDEQAGEEATLAGFLESASLAQDLDALNTDLGCVTLMTLHAAKGLEYPHVYIIGVEQNLIPHERALRTYDEQELEEERRLLFVGITRAEQQLVLTQTTRRLMHGRELSTIPSDFLSEMTLKVVDCVADPFGPVDERLAESWSTPAPLAKAERPPGNSLRALRELGLVTTGAALATGEPASVEIPVGFQVGMSVRHPHYGVGTVVSISAGFSRHRTITVEFAVDQRTESFIASKCPLQPIGLPG